MTIAFEAERRIAESPARVWQRLTDWESAPDWMHGVDACAAQGPVQLGAQLEFVARGKRRHSEITRWKPERELTLTSRQGPVTAAYTYRCEPVGDHDGNGVGGGAATRVTLVADCEIRGPLRLFGPLLRRAIASSDRGQLEALAACFEREFSRRGA